MEDGEPPLVCASRTTERGQKPLRTRVLAEQQGTKSRLSAHVCLRNSRKKAVAAAATMTSSTASPEIASPSVLRTLLNAEMVPPCEDGRRVGVTDAP